MMKLRRRLSRWIALLPLLALAAHPIASQRPELVDETYVVAIEVPVQVLLDGQPVRGLTRDNFEIFEGRRPQSIVDFEVVDLATDLRPDGAPILAGSDAISPAGRRHFLFLFDLANSEPAAMSKARGAAQRLLRERLHPTDLAAVATYSYRQGPRLVLGFSSDRRQVDAAIASLGLVDTRERGGDPLGLIVAELNPRSPADGVSGGSDERPGAEEADAAFAEMLRELSMFERRGERQIEQAELKSMTDGYVHLARLMSRIDGRKHVVLLSQGFDTGVVLGSQTVQEREQDDIAIMSGETWTVDTDERYGTTRGQNLLEQMIAELRRADCVVQAIDIGGLTADADLRPRASGREGLFTMARGTGGQLYEKYNDFGEAMEQMLTATSVTYVLTFQSQNVRSDGRYRELRVRLKDVPRGARVVHRPGYYNPRPDARRAAFERRLETSHLVVAGRPAGKLLAGATAAALPTTRGWMHVPVVIEIDGRSLLAQAVQDEPIPAASFVYAFDSSGTVQDFSAQSFAVDPAQVGSRLERESLKLVTDLILKPGEYVLRIFVRAGDSESFRLFQLPLSVADGRSAATLTPPLLPQPMTSGVVVRDPASEAKTKDLAYPFVDGEEFFLPSGMPKVALGGGTRLWVGAAGFAGDQPIELTASLVDTSGQPVDGTNIAFERRTAGEVAGVENWGLTLQPGEAIAGSYTLQLTARQGERTASSISTVELGQ